MGPFTFPTADDFTTYFFRDFPYGTDPTSNVVAQDIQNALSEMTDDFPQGLFATQSEFTTCALLLAAHIMVMSIKEGAGLNAQPAWIQTQKAVGNVSESFQIPQRIMDNPYYAWLCQTYYGRRYLMKLLPRLNGQMFTVQGRTKP